MNSLAYILHCLTVEWLPCSSYLKLTEYGALKGFRFPFDVTSTLFLRRKLECHSPPFYIYYKMILFKRKPATPINSVGSDQLCSVLIYN